MTKGSVFLKIKVQSEIREIKLGKGLLFIYFFKQINEALDKLRLDIAARSPVWGEPRLREGG